MAAIAPAGREEGAGADAADAVMAAGAATEAATGVDVCALTGAALTDMEGVLSVGLGRLTACCATGDAVAGRVDWGMGRGTGTGAADWKAGLAAVAGVAGLATA